jgi:hypothetical protein
MAETAPKVAAEERRESLAAVDREADALAKQIKKASTLSFSLVQASLHPLVGYS